MSYGWPATIDPIQLAKRGERLAGRLPIRQLPRVAALCVDNTGDLEVELDFTHSQTEDLLEVSGRVRGEIRLTCQRCLEPMPLPLESVFRLTLLRPSERSDLLDDADVLVVAKPMSVAEIIEDELLLAMPMIPMHALAECPAKRYVASAPEQEARKNTIATQVPAKPRRRPNNT